MSDAANSGSGGGGGEVVRGNGHAPGQGLGEAMPSVRPDVQPARPGDFKRMMRERDNAARNPPAKPAAPTPQKPAEVPTRRSHIAEFSERLEAKQQAPVEPNAPKPTKGENMGDPNQLKEPGNLEKPAGEEQGADTEPGEQEQQPQAEEPTALDDLAALNKFREWETSDMFPEELNDKLHEVKVNGQLRYVDTNELRQGYMRGGDYRRFYQEAQQHMQQAQQVQQSMRQHFEQVRDPKTMLELYERNGYGDTLLQVAHMIADRERGNMRIVRAAMTAEMQRLGVQDDRDHRIQQVKTDTEARIKKMNEAENLARRTEFDKQQLQQEKDAREKQSRMQENQALYERQLNQLRPNAFKAYGLKDTEGNRAALARHIGNVIAVHGFEGNVTRALVMEAAADLRDELDQRMAAEQGQGGAMSPEDWKRASLHQKGEVQRNTGRVLPPNRAGLGGGKPLGNLGGKQRGTVRDLETMVRNNRLRPQ